MGSTSRDRALSQLFTRQKASAILETWGIYFALLLVIIISASLSPGFYSLANIVNVSRSAAILAIVGLGQTFCIIAGGIDLSIGATMGTVAIVASEISRGKNDDVGLAIVACLGVGLAVGLANGLIITKRRTPPFVTTLAMMIFVEGIRMAWTEGIISGRPAPLLRELAAIRTIPIIEARLIPIPVVILIVFGGISALVLYKTPLGRSIYATGGNREAARLSGINVDNVSIFTYVFSGLAAAIAGLVLVGYINYADRYLGRGFDLDSIAAVVVGGASFAGGRGRIENTIAGVLLITILFNIVVMLGLPIDYQLIIKGAVIVGAAAMYSAARR